MIRRADTRRGTTWNLAKNLGSYIMHGNFSGEDAMTYLNVAYRYRGKLTPKLLDCLAALRSYYGFVRLHCDENQNLLWVEYDASRLKEADVFHQLRLTGVEITEKVELTPAA